MAELVGDHVPVMPAVQPDSRRKVGTGPRAGVEVRHRDPDGRVRDEVVAGSLRSGLRGLRDGCGAMVAVLQVGEYQQDALFSEGRRGGSGRHTEQGESDQHDEPAHRPSSPGRCTRFRR